MRNLRRILTTLLAGALVAALVATPALAHGDDEEADPVNLVEQALAIVVNTPTAADEALERIEAALAAEESEPTGELDVASLEIAALSLEGGDLHEAEDALVAALGSDPHAGSTDPQEAVAEPAIQPGEGSTADSHPETIAPESVGSQESVADAHDEPSANPGPGATEVAAHGLTDRVDGGFRSPSGLDAAALAAAVVLAVGGFGLVFKRGRHA